MNKLKPKQFVHLRGKWRRLDVELSALIKTKQKLPHTLIFGEAGLGKSTLAELIAIKMTSNDPIKYMGLEIKDTKELSILMRNAPKNGIIIIDEIHQLSKPVQAALVQELKYGSVSIIGTTLRRGALLPELQTAFKSSFKVEPLNDAAMKVLVSQNARKLGLKITSSQITSIAAAAEGNPRKANIRLRKMKKEKANG